MGSGTSLHNHVPHPPSALSLALHADAGLGGGSGNAATTLWAANELCGRPASNAELLEVSSQCECVCVQRVSMTLVARQQRGGAGGEALLHGSGQSVSLGIGGPLAAVEVLEAGRASGGLWPSLLLLVAARMHSQRPSLLLAAVARHISGRASPAAIGASCSGLARLAATTQKKTATRVCCSGLERLAATFPSSSAKEPPTARGGALVALGCYAVCAAAAVAAYCTGRCARCPWCSCCGCLAGAAPPLLGMPHSGRLQALRSCR